MKKGRAEEAGEILHVLHDDPETVNKEIRDIQISLDLSGHTSMRSLAKMGPQRTLHRVLIACVAQMMLQLTGVNSITYYASSLYTEQLGFTAKVAEILAATSQFCIILGSIISPTPWTAMVVGLSCSSLRHQCRSASRSLRV